MKFRIVSFSNIRSHESIEEALELLAKQGWELVSHAVEAYSVSFVLRKVTKK